MTATIRRALKAAQHQFEQDAERTRLKRQAAFKRAHEGGLSYAEIAEVVGLSKSRVEQIVKGK